MIGYPNVLRLAAGAGSALAPATSAIEPTLAEAVEEHARAKRYRNSAVGVGLAVGAALGLTLIILRR